MQIADQAATAASLETVVVRIPDESSPDAGCAKESARFAIAGVLATAAPGKKVHLVSTDGKMLAIVPTDDEAPAAQEVRTIVPSSVVKAAMKPGRGRTPAILKIEPAPNTPARCTAVHPKGETSLPSLEGSFPPFLSVVPDPTDKAIGYRPIGVNVEFLARAAEALGTTSLTILIPDKASKPYMVLPVEGQGIPGALAVVMPFTVKEGALEHAASVRAAIVANCAQE